MVRRAVCYLICLQPVLGISHELLPDTPIDLSESLWIMPSRTEKMFHQQPGLLQKSIINIYSLANRAAPVPDVLPNHAAPTLTPTPTPTPAPTPTPEHSLPTEDNTASGATGGACLSTNSIQTVAESCPVDEEDELLILNIGPMLLAESIPNQITLFELEAYYPELAVLIHAMLARYHESREVLFSRRLMVSLRILEALNTVVKNLEISLEEKVDGLFRLIFFAHINLLRFIETPFVCCVMKSYISNPYRLTNVLDRLAYFSLYLSQHKGAVRLSSELRPESLIVSIVDDYFETPPLVCDGGSGTVAFLSVLSKRQSVSSLFPGNPEAIVDAPWHEQLPFFYQMLTMYLRRMDFTVIQSRHFLDLLLHIMSAYPDFYVGMNPETQDCKPADYLSFIHRLNRVLQLDSRYTQISPGSIILLLDQPLIVQTLAVFTDAIAYIYDEQAALDYLRIMIFKRLPESESQYINITEVRNWALSGLDFIQHPNTRKEDPLTALMAHYGPGLLMGQNIPPEEQTKEFFDCFIKNKRKTK